MKKPSPAVFAPAGGPPRILENIFAACRSKDRRTNAASYPDVAAFAVLWSAERAMIKTLTTKEKGERMKKNRGCGCTDKKYSRSISWGN